MPISASDFPAFFAALHGGTEPFPWQTRLAKQVCGEGWPDVIDLPTASGKTACLDIAVFALAVNPRMPRRIFFVVDRRLIVDEAYQRMCRVANRLKAASEGILHHVGQALRDAGGGTCEDPLTVYQLRGGIYSDKTWAENPLQPIVVTSTVDQVGSRLLFRGYGVSDSVRPIHAAMIANDALLFLDEAHISTAFAQTLQAIERYRGPDWAADPVARPFRFVEMTATPVRPSERIFQLDEKDRAHPVLRKRLFASKPTELVVSQHKLKDYEKLARTLAERALSEAKLNKDARRIAIIVNRVATARSVYQLLIKARNDEYVHLLIGRMRPLDRDRFLGKIADLKSGAPRLDTDPVRFVVATQTLEVGADLDFDFLITECAAIDALQQRFGRLNRTGSYDGSRGIVMIGADDIDPKKPDPVYGLALSKTWKRLQSLAVEGPVDFGIESATPGIRTVGQLLGPANSENAELRVTKEKAPVLLPAHLDALCQTNPAPYYEPSVDLFLHGRDTGEPDVQVVWRADLAEDNVDSWEDIVGLCPPVSSEAMTVPISAFRKWFFGEEQDPASSDLERNAVPESSQKASNSAAVRFGVVYRGKDSKRINKRTDVSPGDTIVLPVSGEGWDTLGHIPAGDIDIAEEAQRVAKRRLVIRLHPALLQHWPDTAAKLELQAYLKQPEIEPKELIGFVWERAVDLAYEPLTELLKRRRGIQVRPYPQLHDGFVLSRRLRLDTDDGNDDTSDTTPVLLANHTRHVEQAVSSFESLMAPFSTEFATTAHFHDFGKSDPRFQALLYGGNRQVADLAPARAKSGSVSSSREERNRQRSLSELPDGFRHELFSLLFAPAEATDLTRHLIASHHGYCRPFAPYICDPNPPSASFDGATVSPDTRLRNPAHHLSSGIPERFWTLTRRFGWWGLAYYEALFRLADWKASSDEMRDGAE